MSVEPVRRDSLYEYLSPNTKVMSQHIIDKFDGDVLHERWTTYNIVGAQTFAMRDGINGGFQITTGASVGDRGGITFGNIRQYDPFNSRFIQYATAISGTQPIIAGGGGTPTGPDPGSSNSERISYRRNTISGFYDLNVSDGAISTSVDSDIAVDLLQHRHQLDSVNTASYYSIDGVFKVTATTNLPNSQLKPFFVSWTNAANAAVGSIQLMEAFNY